MKESSPVSLVTGPECDSKGSCSYICEDFPLPTWGQQGFQSLLLTGIGKRGWGGLGKEETDILAPVLPVALEVTICQDSSLYKHHEGTPAGQDDGQLQKIPLAAKVTPFLLPHELALEKGPERFCLRLGQCLPLHASGL